MEGGDSMKKPVVVVIVALAVLAGGMSTAWVLARRSAAIEAAKWKATEAELRAKLAAAERVPQTPPPEEPEEPPPGVPAPVTPRAPKVVVDDATSRQALLQIIEEREKQLTSAEGMLRDMQSRLQEMTTKLEQLQDQQAKLQASEAQLRERVDSLTQQAAGQEAAVKSKEVRLAEVEQSNQELRKKSDDSGRRLARLQQLAESFDELARRREAYLTNILGRYREATDLFRAVSVRLEQPRDSSVPLIGASDVSRIQNAISLAEEDMRQLRGLNTRAATLQKDLKEIGRR